MTGTYDIEFPTVQEPGFTDQNQGDDDTLDSDVDPLTNRIDNIVVEKEDILMNYDAGLLPKETTVRLTSLRAEEVYVNQSSFGVSIKWSTSTEVDTFGFEIYRSHDSNFKNALSLPNSVTLSKGGDAEYEFIDTTPIIDNLYGYWLVEIQNDGTKYSHGPMRVEINGVESIAQPLSSNSIYLPVVRQ